MSLIIKQYTVDAFSAAVFGGNPAAVCMLQEWLPEAVMLSARGEAHDCVSRSFAPKLGIDEDPVCGSGHCHIFPYWAARLGKNSLSGEAASRRGGILHGEVNGGRTILKGQAVLFAQSEIHI